MGERDDSAERNARLRRQRALGAELRATFRDITEEEVPERLRALAEKLDERLGDGSPAPNSSVKKS